MRALRLKPQLLKICIIGSGVVGQATGKALIYKGFNVSFIDVNKEKVETLRKDGFHAYLPEDLVNGNFDFDISFITVSTPTIGKKLEYSYLKKAAQFLGEKIQLLNKYHLVVIKSTVPPGTTRNMLKPIIEKASGKLAGRDFGLCMNPEYLREVSSLEDTINAWFIVVGSFDERSRRILESVYNGFDCPKEFTTLEEAEAEKYVHNLFNAVKITYFNEMRQVLRTLGVDAERVFPLVVKSCEGLWNPKYGTKNMGPFSGMCLPKDTQAFLSYAMEKNIKMPLLDMTIKVNDTIPPVTLAVPKVIPHPRNGHRPHAYVRHVH